VKLLKPLKTALVTGLLIVLPAWLSILLLLKVLLKLGVIVKPLAGQMPAGVNHPTIIALVTFILICMAVGLLFHTAIGKMVGKMIEEAVLSRIPGYSSLRSIAAQVGDFESNHNFKPALIDVEDGCLAPAFLIEEHENGLSTVFMPSVPTPMAGGIFIMPSERVKLVDVSVATMMKCISKWGTGSGEIISALPPESLPKSS
jgi:uncharacterized membrane protein